MNGTRTETGPELPRLRRRVTLTPGLTLARSRHGNMCSILGITVTLAQLFTGENRQKMLSIPPNP